MHHRLFRLIVLGALCAFTIPSLSAASDTPSFGLRVEGSGPPVILIPGFVSSGAVWDEVVERYRTRYQCHVLTLPGFAGQPAVDGPVLPRVRDEIIAYIRHRQLDHPVLVGHSMGGFLALWIAAAAPDLVGPVSSPSTASRSFRPCRTRRPRQNRHDRRPRKCRSCTRR